MRVLGIESSCDESAAAIVEDGRTVIGQAVHSQIPVHRQFGGVVPELASRNHVTAIIPVIEEALQAASMTLDDIDAVAVTRGPGLIGSLLVGLQVAKTIAYTRGLPFTGVDHVSAHLYAVFLDRPSDEAPGFPHVGLAVSGGHTSLYLVEDHLTRRPIGATLDDAAGEAFDKAAKMLGLPYPGGVTIDTRSVRGDGGAIKFPRPMLRGNKTLNFSFSGVKTAVRTHLETYGPEGPSEEAIDDICASFQEAVVEVLVTKLLRAAEEHQVRDVVIAGGVAANTRLRQVAEEAAASRGVRLFVPALRYCTDNAAMIAGLGAHMIERGVVEGDPLTLDATATLFRGVP